MGGLHVCRCMRVQLLRMHAECAAHAKRGSLPPIACIVAMATLALFLSYLSFAHGAAVWLPSGQPFLARTAA